MLSYLSVWCLSFPELPDSRCLVKLLCCRKKLEASGSTIPQCLFRVSILVHSSEDHRRSVDRVWSLSHFSPSFPPVVLFVVLLYASCEAPFAPVSFDPCVVSQDAQELFQMVMRLLGEEAALCLKNSDRRTGNPKSGGTGGLLGLVDAAPKVRTYPSL